MILTICEKPSQARDIARHLKATKPGDGYYEGNGYQVTWCVGHLLELAPPDYYRPDIKPWRIEKLPVIPKQWKMLVSQRTKKQFNIIKQLLKNTNHVLIATDPDREGEAIAREILEYCDFSGKIERLWLSALDDLSIKKALNHIRPGADTESLYFAGQARSKSDYLIGLNLTMAVSALYGVNSVLSIGRVQTPTLKLVVDRDRAIENFKSQTYFVLTALFSSNDKTRFWATWQAPENYVGNHAFCYNQQLIEGIATKVDDEPGIVKSFTETQKKQKAPLCFSLSVLQKKASSLFGYSAKQVLALAQSLYETHKATTYPRTDCGYLPEEQFDQVPLVLSALVKVDPTLQTIVRQCDVTFKSVVWNTKKITAHHAIIPTCNDQVAIGKMSPEELTLYDLIRHRYLAQFMGDYEYKQCKIDILCASENFVATRHTPIKPGWKQAFMLEDKTENEANENHENIPELSQGQSVSNQDTRIERKQTKSPARFTEGTLIEAMKTIGQWVEDAALKSVLKHTLGIGTEATRANIIETLFKRGYLTRQAKRVTSSKKGRALIDLLPDQIKNPCLTAQWEQKLEAIAEGQGDVRQFVASQAVLLTEILKQLQNDTSDKRAAILQLQSDTHNNKVYLCPQCESPLRRLKNKKGYTFWGCTQYPGCTFTTWEKHGKPNL